MKFKGVWRDYQDRVLAEMDTHLVDGRLHVVAAPGSGKTVLGLEAMRQMARPTLVLAPNLTIRDQWRERLFPLFLDDRRAWDAEISYDIEAPATMTIATYQALHAVYAAGPDRFDALVETLEAKGPLTLIVDEAHHLRREWWTALFALRDGLKDTTLIALTATPPYDAPFAEWTRYETLCGPIDCEISVPELVRNGDLCPHQDFVHVTLPRQDELDRLLERRAAITNLVAGLLEDADLIDTLGQHPWLIAPKEHEEELLERPDYLTALMILLHAAGRKLPRAATRMLGVGDTELPPLSAEWLERLFNGLINEPRTRAQLGDTRWKEIRRVLDKLGLIRNDYVTFDESQAVFSAISDSDAKLESIVAIVRAETQAMGDALRLVILSDRVRADELPLRADATFKPAKLGVIPIFETLRRAGAASEALAVLTGTIVILPATVLDVFGSEAARLHIDLKGKGWRELGGCPGYSAFDASGDASSLVMLVTRLFQSGVIRVLIGTQALLGEGWDAPAINSLLLASNAGSYMLSNQMRGRAIRIDPAAPDKVAAVWHLGAVFPAGDNRSPAQQPDIDVLSRRFEAFEGISNNGDLHIQNGLIRLGLDFTVSAEAQNSATLARARDRAWIAAKWKASLGGATPRSHVRRVAEASYAPRQLAWRDTLQALVFSAISGGAFSAAGAIRRFESSGIVTVLALFLGATFLYSLPKLLRAGLLWRRNGSLEGSLTQVSETVIAGLCYAGALTRDPENYLVVIRRAVTGRCDIIIDGATRAEERIFLDAIVEVLGPVQNPRYLLVRRSRFWGARRTDYHAVPSVLGARKDLAEFFADRWRQQVGNSLLIYTRTGEGRQALLRARVRSFAAGMQRFFQRRSVWM